jgi:hypothetical protein
MIHIHIDNYYPTAMNIHVDISVKNSTVSPIISNRYYSNDNQNKKIYTLQQIYDNVERIQKYYENSIPSSSSCFLSLKKMRKIFKAFKPSQTKPIKQSNQLENKSPFIFGGETLQWIALPQYNDHIYENDFIH